MGLYQHNNSPVDVKNLLAPASEVPAWQAAFWRERQSLLGAETLHQILPGTFQEFDHIGDATDRAWILHHRHLFHHGLGQHGEIALLDRYVAQARRAVQTTDELSHRVDRSPSRLFCSSASTIEARGLSDQRHTFGSYRQVELHGMGEHDAGSLPVWHMAMTAKLVANGVADARAYAAETHD